jgi:N-acyl-D-aspartate/D-glutamate deacylase
MDDPFPLNACDVFAELMSGTADQRRRAYADPAWRDRAKRSTDAMTTAKPRWDTYVIDASVRHPQVVGTSLAELAARARREPLDALLDLADEPESLWVRAIVMNDDEVEVADLLQAEHCALGLSDAGAHVGQLCDAPQATDLLGRWVRERGVLTIEEAVRRLTSAQADLFGFVDRGRLAPGMAADIVVFDPSTVGPGPITRVADFPAGGERLTAAEPVGVRHVLVNGEPIRRDGEQIDLGAQRPGQLVAPHERMR